MCTCCYITGRIVQFVTCLAADACMTADPGVASLISASSHTSVAGKCMAADPEVMSSIPARSHTFVEIDHEIISMVILLPSAYSRRVVVSYKGKCVHKVLFNCLVKLAQEKSG